MTPHAMFVPPEQEQQARIRFYLDEVRGALSLALVGAVMLSLGGVTGRLQWLSLLGLAAWPLLRRYKIV